MARQGRYLAGQTLLAIKSTLTPLLLLLSSIDLSRTDGWWIGKCGSGLAMVEHGIDIQAIPYLSVFEALFAVLVALLVLPAIVYAYFRHLIRTQFPEAWREMGEPTFLNQSVSKIWPTFRYVIWQARYRAIPNKKVKLLGDTVRIGYFLFMLVFFAYVTLFFSLRSSH